MVIFVAGLRGYGGMADAQDSGSCVSNDVQVQVLLPAPPIRDHGGTGRRVRLRGVWLPRPGSSPGGRTKKEQVKTCSFFINIF